MIAEDNIFNIFLFFITEKSLDEYTIKKLFSKFLFTEGLVR